MPGSRKGIPNVITRDVREMILGALSEGGGQRWLLRQMNTNPTAFMTLVGKIIPQQIDATIRRELPEMTREQLLALLEHIPRRPMIDATPLPNADKERTPLSDESLKH